MKMSPQEFVATLNKQLGPDEKEIKLSEDQAKVVGAPPTPTLVVAGAGSGKTEVMSLRALYLIYREGYSPDSVLGLTFTRKATSNFAERIQRQLALMRKAGLIEPDPLAEWGATVSTYNSFAAEIVREHGLLIGVQPRATLITEARSWQIVDWLLESYRGDLPDNSQSSIREAVLKLSADMTDHGVDFWEAEKEWVHLADVIDDPQPGVSSETNRTRTKHDGNVQKFGQRMRDKAKLIPLVQAYQGYKRENNLMDFTDQLALARKILDANPQVVEDIRGQYQAILLDEFQDTSVGQLELFSTLFHDTAVTAVGDPNQAIYGWRGASAASLAMFIPHFASEPKSQVLQLRDAWRNWPAILEAANVVSKPDEVETSARAEIYGKAQPSVSANIEIKELRANTNHPGNGVVKYLYPSTEEQEFDLVARLIHNWKTNVEPGKKPPTIAILARKRKHFVPLDRALRNYGISPYIVGIGGLVTQPTITDIRAVMRVLVDPDHGPSVMRLISNLDLSSNDISILWDWARELGRKRVHTRKPDEVETDETATAETGQKAEQDPAADQGKNAEQGKSGQDLRVEFLLDTVLNPPEVGWNRRAGQGFSALARSRVMQLSRRLNFVREHFDLGIAQVISRVVTAFDLDIDIQSDPLENQGEVAIDAFIEIAANFESETPYASVKNFLDWVDMTVEADERYEVPVAELDDDTVKILTIHQAKGLEWDKVVVVGLNENDFPGVGSRRNDADDGETLRGEIPEITPTGGWMSSLGELPYDLRSDRELEGQMILPELGSLDGLDVVETFDLYEDYRRELALHELREARRLAYVACTRASNELVLSGSWFRETSPLVPSRYLKQMIQGKGSKGALIQPVTVEEVTVEGFPEPPTPVVDGRNDAEPSEGSVDKRLVFPKQPSFSRKKITQTAQWVTHRITELQSAQAISETTEENEEQQFAFDYLQGVFNDLKGDLSVKEAAEQGLLLEQVKDAVVRQKIPKDSEIAVELDRLSATQVERLLSSPEDFARSIRRPLPQKPSTATHIGSVFHGWAEQWCAKAASFDPNLEPETQVPSDELGESADPTDVEGLSAADRSKLELMQDRAREIFGDRPKNVHSVEEAFAYSADGMTIRGRYDAIFQEDGRWLIVDWKTGAPPTKQFQNQYLPSYATQLEVYRRAFAQSRNLQPDEVEAELVFLGGEDTKPENRRVRLDNLRELLDDYDFERDWKRAIKMIQPDS